MNAEQLEMTRKAVEPFPHQFVGMIPFSREITSDTPIIGNDYIPYGSTLMTTVLQKEHKMKGLFFDLDEFNYAASIKHRNDMLNENMILTLDKTIEFMRADGAGRDWFVRPSHDLKQFSGQVMDAKECADWLEDAKNCDSSGSYKMDSYLPIVIAEPANIQAEWRWFVVGGEVVSGSMYRAHGQLRKMRVVEPELIKEAQEFANGWLPAPCVVMDLALVDDELKVIEFNCINSSGFYDNDVEKIFKSLYNYCVTL